MVTIRKRKSRKCEFDEVARPQNAETPFRRTKFDPKRSVLSLARETTQFTLGSSPRDKNVAANNGKRNQERDEFV